MKLAVLLGAVAVAIVGVKLQERRIIDGLFSRPERFW